MKRLGYEALGFAVWHGGKWYLRRRLGVAARRGRRALLVLAVGGGVAAVAVRASRRP